MSANAVGAFGVGTDPPPDSRLPRARLVILDVSVSTFARSACVIWPTFSCMVMRPSKSATRCFTGSRGLRYGAVPGAAAWGLDGLAEAWAAPKAGTRSAEPTAAAVSAPTRERAKRTFKMILPRRTKRYLDLNRLGGTCVKGHSGAPSADSAGGAAAHQVAHAVHQTDRRTQDLVPGRPVGCRRVRPGR